MTVPDSNLALGVAFLLLVWRYSSLWQLAQWSQVPVQVRSRQAVTYQLPACLEAWTLQTMTLDCKTKYPRLQQCGQIYS
jgi:hypothetical protein